MTEKSPSLNTTPPPADLSPWAHPKAQRWFEELLEHHLLPTTLDNEVVAAVQHHELEKVRVILALALLIGREGIWPTSRNNVLKSAIRSADHLTKTAPPEQGKKPMSLMEHRGRALHTESLQQEIELLRRRLKLSNRRSTVEPPVTWGNLWE